MEIKMLQEEIDAKEKEANNRKRVIQGTIMVYHVNITSIDIGKFND